MVVSFTVLYKFAADIQLQEDRKVAGDAFVDARLAEDSSWEKMTKWFGNSMLPFSWISIFESFLRPQGPDRPWDDYLIPRFYALKAFTGVAMMVAIGMLRPSYFNEEANTLSHAIIIWTALVGTLLTWMLLGCLLCLRRSSKVLRGTPEVDGGKQAGVKSERRAAQSQSEQCCW